ncbi:hypothetical protein J2741_000328 [Methanolinea mesophila]|nr:hypothetical protein [Methanolinea mesophila]
MLLMRDSFKAAAWIFPRKSARKRCFLCGGHSWLQTKKSSHTYREKMLLMWDSFKAAAGRSSPPCKGKMPL